MYRVIDGYSNFDHGNPFTLSWSRYKLAYGTSINVVFGLKGNAYVLFHTDGAFA
jgi:hypothetical protein